MKRSFIVALLAGVLFGAGPADAAKQAPTATIDDVGGDLRWGGHVTLDSSVRGADSNATLHDAVFCTQDGRVVYQGTAAPGASLPLQQQSGLAAVGAVIDSTRPAHCTGWVRYEVASGRRNVTILTLAAVEFDIAAA